jgi:hypothetical protein
MSVSFIIGFIIGGIASAFGILIIDAIFIDKECVEIDVPDIAELDTDEIMGLYRACEDELEERQEKGSVYDIYRYYWDDEEV